MSYDPNSWPSVRAHLGHLALTGAPEAEIIEAKLNYRALRLAELVRKELAGDPPLNDEQRARIADLLLTGGGAQ